MINMIAIFFLFWKRNSEKFNFQKEKKRWILMKTNIRRSIWSNKGEMPPPKEPSHNRKWFIFNIFSLNIYGFFLFRSCSFKLKQTPDFCSDILFIDYRSDMIIGVIGLYSMSLVQRTCTDCNKSSEWWLRRSQLSRQT